MSKIKEDIKIKGTVHVTHRDKDGKVKGKFTIPNLVVTAGKQWVADQMDDVSSLAKMSHMAIGTSSTAPAVGDTTLGAEAARVSLSGTVRAGAVVTFSATFGAGTGTGAIVEAGIFNNVTGGTLLSRVTFSVVNKAAGDTLSIDWDITVT